MRKVAITEQIIENLMILSDQVRYLARMQGLEHGLSILQLRVLHFLAKTTVEQHYSREMGVLFQISNATLSEAVKTLKLKELIKVKKEKKDGRKIQLYLTERGKEIAHITLLYTKPIKDTLLPIPYEEQEILLNSLEGIATKLNKTL